MAKNDNYLIIPRWIH